MNDYFERVYNNCHDIVMCNVCGGSLNKKDAVILLDNKLGMKFFHKDCGDGIVYRKTQTVVAIKEADNNYTTLHGEKTNRTMYPNKKEK